MKMNIDTSHSEVGFKVKHLMISTVKGSFTTVMGTAEGELDNLNISVTIDPTSINTNDEGRDEHLKSSDFFQVKNFPSIDFVANNVNVNNGAITGEMTIKGVTKEVTLALDYNGKGVDPWGNVKHGFEISGKINRNDFGLTWNAALEAGGVLVSEEVTLTIDVQAVEVAE
jgi:polyisoprenoid-binding protein YceI